MQQKRKLNLPAWIIIGMLAGIAVGFIFLKIGGTFTTDYLKPFGTIYINLLKFMVVPVVLFSIMKGRQCRNKDLYILHLHHGTRCCYRPCCR